MSSPAVAALRGKAADTYVVLDEEDRIVSVSLRLHSRFSHWLGHVVWDHLPGARDVCGPCFEEARASGEPVESVVFYSGRVERLTAIPASDGLAVHVECLAELDVTTLGTLTKSLETIAAALGARVSARPDPRSPASLRALP